MWIRTQDKKRLIEINEIEMRGERTIDLITGDDTEDFSAVINSNPDIWVAYYSSYENAQKAMNKLQKAIRRNKRVFQMPKNK